MNAGNRGGNEGNRITIKKNKIKVYKRQFSFFAEFEKKKRN